MILRKPKKHMLSMRPGILLFSVIFLLVSVCNGSADDHPSLTEDEYIAEVGKLMSEYMAQREALRTNYEQETAKLTQERENMAEIRQKQREEELVIVARFAKEMADIDKQIEEVTNRPPPPDLVSKVEEINEKLRYGSLSYYGDCFTSLTRLRRCAQEDVNLLVVFAVVALIVTVYLYKSSKKAVDIRPQPPNGTRPVKSAASKKPPPTQKTTRTQPHSQTQSQPLNEAHSTQARAQPQAQAQAQPQPRQRNPQPQHSQPPPPYSVEGFSPM